MPAQCFLTAIYRHFKLFNVGYNVRYNLVRGPRTIPKVPPPLPLPLPLPPPPPVPLTTPPTHPVHPPPSAEALKTALSHRSYQRELIIITATASHMLQTMQAVHNLLGLGIEHIALMSNSARGWVGGVWWGLGVRR